jgi:hypothetical protein
MDQSKYTPDHLHFLDHLTIQLYRLFSKFLFRWSCRRSTLLFLRCSMERGGRKESRGFFGIHLGLICFCYDLQLIDLTAIKAWRFLYLFYFNFVYTESFELWSSHRQSSWSISLDTVPPLFPTINSWFYSIFTDDASNFSHVPLSNYQIDFHILRKFF